MNLLLVENSKYIIIKFFEKINIRYYKYFTQQIFNYTTYNLILKTNKNNLWLNINEFCKLLEDLK